MGKTHTKSLQKFHATQENGDERMNRVRFLAITVIAALFATLWSASPALAQGSAPDAAPATNLDLGSISLQVTVATSEVCSSDVSIVVDQGASLYFCYTVTNTGGKVLRLHSLSDSAFGEVLKNIY